MQRFTTEKYKCVDCKRSKHLVISRGQASRCKGCYLANLVKKRTIRKLNKIFGDLI